MKGKIALFVLFFNSLVFCTNSRQTNEFYIELPENWIQIPKESVNFLIKETNRPSRDQLYGNYTYLYQPGSTDTLFTLPYFLIQVNSSRRLSKSELLANKYMKVDKTTGYLWSVKDSTIDVIIPTEKGSINIYCLSDGKNAEMMKPIFTKIIKSVVVSHDLTYKDDFIHNTPFIRDIVKKENFSTFMFLILVAVILAARVYKRKMSSK